MEVGEKTIDTPKGVARSDKEIGPSFAGMGDTGVIGYGFQYACSGCANGDDPSPFAPGPSDAGSRFRVHLVELLIHVMFTEILSLDRSESARSDM